MNDDVLDDYLDRPIIVHFQNNQKTPPYEEGILHDFSSTGIILKRDSNLLFIPFSSIHTVEIQPKATFWQRLIGAV